MHSASVATREPPLAQPEPTPERAAAGTGTLHLVVRGAWAEVWIDGQKLGRVPPQNRYPLTAGEHELELRNPNLTPYRQKVLILPNATSPYTVDFTAAARALSFQQP
jgi:PEGA domain